MFHI